MLLCLFDVFYYLTEEHNVRDSQLGIVIFLTLFWDFAGTRVKYFRILLCFQPNL